jgi:hypothetical protein
MKGYKNIRPTGGEIAVVFKLIDGAPLKTGISEGIY